MSEKKQIDFSKKFEFLMGEDSTYEFFLKMQYIMPKYAKKKDPEFFSFLFFAIEHLAKYEENESISSLFIQSIQLYVNNHPNKKIENPSYFMDNYHKLFKMVPVKSDKSMFKYKFLELCEANGITEDVIFKENIYYEFAIDSRENKYLLEGYRFGIKSMNLDIISEVVKDILNTEKYKMGDKEKQLFVARTCLEILVNKDINMAKEFIFPYINDKKDYEHNEPIINMAYFICLLLNDKNVPFEKVPESELKNLQIEYQNYLRTDKKDDLELATRSYLSLQKLIKSNLEETIKVIKAQESDPEIQALTQDFFKAIKNLNFINLDDDSWIENLDRLTQETQYGGNIISQQIQLLKNTYSDLLEKLNQDKSKFTEALNQEYDNIVKQNNEALEKGLIDEETARNSNEQAAKEKSKKYSDFVENSEREIKEYFAKKRDEILIEGQLKQGLELIDKFLKVGYINGAIKDRVFAGLDNILNAVEQYSKSIETNDTEKANIAEAEELIKNGLISSLEEAGISESRLKDIDYDNNVLKPAIEDFKQKIEQLKKLKYTPILQNLDQFALNINGGNISGLLSALGKMLYSNASNIQSFNIGDELYKQLNEAERIIQLYIAALEGARTDNVDPFRVSITRDFKSEDTSNVWGINKVLNEVHAKAPKLENDPWEDLPEIEGNNANMMLMDAESILETLQTYKKLYNLNQGQKLNVQTKVATRTTLLLYRRVKDLLSNIDLDDYYKDEAKKALAEANLNKLEELTQNNPEDWNLDLSQEDLEQIERERIQMEDAIYSFFNSKLIDDEDNLVELFKKSFTLTDDSENPLSENTTSLNDAAFIGYLASKIAIKSTDFHGRFKDILDGQKAPLISQELHIGLTVANSLNGKIVTKVIQAYRQAIVEKLQELPYTERKKFLGTAYATKAMQSLLINHDLVPQYDNITFVEGIAGSGKTGGVINMSVKFLSSYPDITKNAWVIHGGDKENTTKFGEQLKSDLELDSAKVFNRISFLKKLSPDYNSPKKSGSYYEYSKDDYSITEDGRIIPTWKLDNNDDVPSIIIIDEAQQFTQLELLLIDKYAKSHGIAVIASGDLSQSQTVAQIEFSEEFRERINSELREKGEPEIPKTRKNEQTEEVEKIPFKLGFSLARNQVLHAPKLGSSMRTENNQKNKNMISTQVVRSNGKGNLELHYYEDDTTLAGDLVIDNPDTKRDEILKYADKIVALGGKINFATYNKESALTETLKSKYKDSITIEEGVALGQEGDYWIVELDPEKDGNSFMQDFYTGQTRGRKFTLLIAKPEVKMSESGKITFSNAVDQETHKEEYNPDAIRKYAERRKETLNKIIKDNKEIVYIPRESVEKKETVSKEPPKKPYEKPKTTVDLNKSIYKPGTLIEIYTSSGLKQEDQIYEIKAIRETPSGKRVINLENIKNHARVTLNYDDVVSNSKKYKVLDDTIETIYPDETPSVGDGTEFEEKAEDSVSEVIETERTESLIKSELDEATEEDNAEEDKKASISPKGENVEDFDIYLFSNATLETGVTDIDFENNTFEYSTIPNRIDSLNGFKKLQSISTNKNIKTISTDKDYQKGLNVLGTLRRILLTVEDKRSQIVNISSILGLDGKNCYIRYALKTSELSKGGLDSAQKYGKLEEDESEILPFEQAQKTGESTTVQNRKLVAIIGTETNGDVIEIPLLVLNNPITLILSSLYEDTSVQSTYLNTPGNQYNKLSKVKELYRESEPGLCNLIDIYHDTDRHVRFIQDETWTPSSSLTSCGPELNANRGLLNVYGNIDYVQDTRWIDLDELRAQPDLFISDVLRFDLASIEDKDGNNISVVSHQKHPFVLYTDKYLTHDGKIITKDNILNEFLWEKRNHKRSSIKLVYVLPPEFTIDEYVKSVVDFAVNNGKLPLGNQRTAYKVLESLVLTDEEGFDNICISAFGEETGKQVSFKVKNVINELHKLSVPEQINILTKTTQAWNLNRVGIPKSISLFKQLQNIIKQLVYPTSIQVVTLDEGRGVRLQFDPKGVNKFDEQMSLIRPIFEASQTKLYYQTVGDKRNTKNGFTPIRVDSNGHINDDRISNNKFGIRGDLAPTTFRTGKEFNAFLGEIGQKSRAYNEDSTRNNHNSDDDIDTTNYVDGYSGFGTIKPSEKPKSFSSNINRVLQQFGITSEVKPISENDESFETVAAIAEEINSKNNQYKALVVRGQLVISDQFLGHSDVQFDAILTDDKFNGQNYEFQLQQDGRTFNAIFNPDTKELFLQEITPKTDTSVEYDFSSGYDYVTEDVVQNNLNKFKELGEKILNEDPEFELSYELRQAIDNNDVQSLVEIFNDLNTIDIISNPDYNKNFDLINYIDILEFNKTFENEEENVSCSILKIKFK